MAHRPTSNDNALVDSVDLAGDIERTEAAELAGYFAAIDTLRRHEAPAAIIATLVGPDVIARRSYLSARLQPWAERARFGKLIALLRLAGESSC